MADGWAGGWVDMLHYCCGGGRNCNWLPALLCGQWALWTD